MITVKVEDAEIFVTVWKWSADDFKIPLKIRLSDCSTQLFLKDPTRTGSRDDPRQFVLHETVLIHFEDPGDDFIRGLLEPSTERGESAAKKIYDRYHQCLDTFVAYCRLELNAHSVSDIMGTTFSSLFDKHRLAGPKVLWSQDGKTFLPFEYELKKSRKINPIYRSKFLIKTRDWTRLQRAVSSGSMPPAEVQELLKLRAKAQWNERRVPVVESMAIMEMALKNVVARSLLARGLSKTRLSSFSEEGSMFIFLNFMLPLCVSNSNYKRIEPLIHKVDRMRKVRNLIMHENLPESEIDREEVHRGIDSSIDLLLYLKKIGKWSPNFSG